MQRFILVVCLFYSACGWSVESYNTEISSQFGNSSGEDLSLFEFALVTRIYPESVNNRNHPRFEADFLEKASHLEFNANVHHGDIGADRNNASQRAVGINGAWLGGGGPFYLGFAYHREAFQESDEGLINDRRITDSSEKVELEIGWFISRNWLMTMHGGNERQDLADNSRLTANSLGLHMKHVEKLIINRAVVIEGEFEGIQLGFQNRSQKPSVSVFRLMGDYYFTNNMSLGLGVSYSQADEEVDELIHLRTAHLDQHYSDASQTALALNMKYFFNERFGLRSRILGNDHSERGQSQSYLLGIVARF